MAVFEDVVLVLLAMSLVGSILILLEADYDQCQVLAHFLGFIFLVIGVPGPQSAVLQLIDRRLLREPPFRLRLRRVLCV
jgi:hypothetical protein